MKSGWNSLLLAVNLAILPTGASIAIAAPPIPAETIAVTTSTSLIHRQQTEVAQSQPVQSTTAKSPEATKPESDAADETGEILKQKLAQTQRQQKLLEADRLYLGGQLAAAEKIYREVKVPFGEPTPAANRIAPIVDPAQLAPAGKVYWREAQAGATSKHKTRATVPLRLLVEQYPEFIPGHLLLAETLQKHDHTKEALEVLERATTLYPEQPNLVKARVATLAQAEQWMEASLAARQYAILNPNQPDAPEMAQLATANLDRYKKHLRSELRGNAIANVITGTLGYALTGSLFGPFSAIQTSTMLLRGESAIGEAIAKDAARQLELVEDKAVVDYVNQVGQKLAHVAGRDDFKYEFYVVLDDQLNAFALPGGKIFVNAGAITRTNSEAELAGLLAHEISHAVLSHGFQLVTEGNLLANVTQYIPYGGTIADLFTLNYSREMERQADTLGTRLITATGYAADGLRNLMVTLKQQEKSSPPSWLSSHPNPAERVRYLEDQIQRHRYNRYAYEGVGRHSEIQTQVKKLLVQKEQQSQKKHQSK